jgi:DUF971 family protein
MSPLTLEQKSARNIELDRKAREMRITWADGLQSTYSLDYLRKICPCAVCNELRRQEDPLRILKPDQIVTKAELRQDRPVELVGNYALQFFWNDGHNTGLYSFDFLRLQSPQK